MRPSTRRALLWQLVSLMLYACGIGLFLVVAVGVYVAAPTGSLENVSIRDGVFLLVGATFVACGRYVGSRFGSGVRAVTDSVDVTRDKRPEPTKLEELGYRVPPEPNDERDLDYAYVDGTLYRVCRECGANNDSDYRFCRECSAELPE